MFFRESKLKIERAEKHIQELYGHIRAFLDSDFYDFSLKKHPETGEDCFQFKLTKSMPDDFALCTGDVIHNLRSALDIAVSTVVFNSTGQHSKDTKFPFRSSRQELITALDGGTIRQASEKIADLILNVIKPYPGENDALCALHKLDILDKHRLLIPTISAAALIGVRAYDDRGTVLDGNTVWVITESHVEGSYVRIPHTGNLHIQDNGKMSFQIYFERGMPYEGQIIFHSLLNFKKLVDRIIDAFEAAYVPKV